jgi:hypothetical protein
MPVPVIAILWEPAVTQMPISSQEWSMYDLPEPGTHYWHGRTGYLVDQIEDVDGTSRSSGRAGRLAGVPGL